jgi:hypothetical protein
MLVLDSTSKSIQIVMSGAAATTNPDFVSTYSDNNGTTFVEGSSDGALNGTTAVTVVAAPAASTRRIIKTIYVENKDTAAITITITYLNSATSRTIVKVTLQVGDTWTTDGTFDTAGAIKQTLGTVSLTSQVSGVLPTANGGTNLSSFTSGGAVYATSTSVLVTGTLPIASGGTNATATPTAGGSAYGTGTAYAFTSAGTAGQILTSNGASAPTWNGIDGGTFS